MVIINKNMHKCLSLEGKRFFVYDFSGMLGGYGLRCMCLHCARASCDFVYRQEQSSTGTAGSNMATSQPPDRYCTCVPKVYKSTFLLVLLQL